MLAHAVNLVGRHVRALVALRARSRLSCHLYRECVPGVTRCAGAVGPVRVYAANPHARPAGKLGEFHLSHRGVYCLHALYFHFGSVAVKARVILGDLTWFSDNRLFAVKCGNTVDRIHEAVIKRVVYKVSIGPGHDIF